MKIPRHEPAENLSSPLETVRNENTCLKLRQYLAIQPGAPTFPRSS
jgi:hypothetical protein